MNKKFSFFLIFSVFCSGSEQRNWFNWGLKTFIAVSGVVVGYKWAQKSQEERIDSLQLQVNKLEKQLTMVQSIIDNNTIDNMPKDLQKKQQPVPSNPVSANTNVTSSEFRSLVQRVVVLETFASPKDMHDIHGKIKSIADTQRDMLRQIKTLSDQAQIVHNAPNPVPQQLYADIFAQSIIADLINKTSLLAKDLEEKKVCSNCHYANFMSLNSKFNAFKANKTSQEKIKDQEQWLEQKRKFFINNIYGNNQN
jgi:hypothetical protein